MAAVSLIDFEVNEAEITTSGEDVELDDRQIYEELQSDPAAFKDIYKKYYDKIYKHCYYRLGSREDAEDCSMQVFTKAFKSVHKFEYREFTFSAWLYRIAHNEIVNIYRKRGQRQFTDLENVDFFLSDDQHEDIQENLDIEQKKYSLAKFLGTLKNDDRQLLTMKLTDEMTFEEMAEVLNKSVSAVKMKYYRLLEKLKKQIEGNPELAAVLLQ